MKRIGELVGQEGADGKEILGPQRPKSRATERGELMKYFVRKLNVTRGRDSFREMTMSRMGYLLQGIPTRDLYYFKRICDDSPDFSKRFWYELDPKKHTEEAKQKRTFRR